MNREGRQHGMVLCHQIMPQPFNPRPESRYLNRFDSPPTAGLFTRVSPKPTNHSKFTGKCGRPRCRSCHINPAHKSKQKTKGTQKLRSGDVASLVTWRVVDARPESNTSGVSATGLLDQLDEEFDDGDDDCVDEVHDNSCEIASGAVKIKDDDVGNRSYSDDDDENNALTFDLEFVCGDDCVDEDEDWCLLAEM